MQVLDLRGFYIISELKIHEYSRQISLMIINQYLMKQMGNCNFQKIICIL